jgi:hypothetical protein
MQLIQRQRHVHGVPPRQSSAEGEANGKLALKCLMRGARTEENVAWQLPKTPKHGAPDGSADACAACIPSDVSWCSGVDTILLVACLQRLFSLYVLNPFS